MSKILSEVSQDCLNGESESFKVAVIGSGISGMAAAWFLSQKHHVTLFEKNDKLGGHTNTLEVDLPEGRQAVDTGFIVFNRPNYPNLTAMFEYLAVETQETEMSFAVSMNQGQLEYSGSNLNTLFAQRSNLFSWQHWQMLKEITHFNKQAKQDLAANESEEGFVAGFYTGRLALPLGTYLNRLGISEHMKNSYLLPMAAAIWSCPVDTMMKFPAGSFLRFFENHGLLNVSDRPQWETVKGGSQRYIDKLLEKAKFFAQTSCGVERVEKMPSGKLRVISQQQSEEYDHVIFASHGDQTFQMLSPQLQHEFGFLKNFSYQQNIAYLHWDESLMPRRKLAWSSWNYLRDTSQKESAVAVTYWMNGLQAIQSKRPVLVTLNPIKPPSSDKTWQQIVYEHPVFDLKAMAAQVEVQKAQGRGNVWFCGAYNGYGFHEDGLRSAVDIARAWGIALPWEQAESISSHQSSVASMAAVTPVTAKDELSNSFDKDIEGVA
ncbi:NAD(P)/FAD-dependent oxidoreductase [Thiomicrorhabdus indica]|uniref:NAD(P)/FAD-dependent oxidoreductase n=1 Tax=Thiomicrorhabdus indica TaxID=2267253 RepID=UPI00102D8B39|nr:FAD-dependent oxidoreductase [Thiomicrorhabdus indica]